MANKVIISGVPGWLGTAFVDALVNGLADCPELAPPERTAIAALVHPDAAAAASKVAPGIDYISADLCDVAKLKPLFANASGATVFHIAGVIHPRSKVSELYQTNVDGTRNMLNLAIEAGAKRFIYVSSNSPCGCNKSSDERFTESSPYNPYMSYGRSKMQAEQLINQAHARKAIETVIVRPPWFYGPHQPPRQTLFFKMIKDGKVPLVGDGTNKRSMAYVDNICQGLLLSEKVEAANGQTYWIADAEPYAMKDIIDTVEDVLSSDFKIPVQRKRMRLPSIASEVAYVIDAALQGAGAYQQKIHVLSEMNKTIACDISKARKELGYSPKIALREGMKRSVQWVLDNGGTI
jgi:nucleoside-diphosphate-sugar epimerase